jgi:hypothetical protein
MIDFGCLEHKNSKLRILFLKVTHDKITRFNDKFIVNTKAVIVLGKS